MRERIRIGVGILLGAGLLTAGCSGGGDGGTTRSDAPARQGPYQYAMDRLAEGNYLGAAFQLEKVIAADPGNIEAYRHLGRAYTAAGSLHPDYFDRALEVYEKLHTLVPESDLELIADEAFLKRRMWQIDDALVLYEDVLANDPDNCEFWVLLGDGMRDKGVVLREELGEAAESAKLDEALMAYGRAIELCPENLQGHHGIGVILTQRKQYLDVVEMFEELHAIYPKSNDFLREYALALFRARDWQGAAPVFKLLLERDPRDQERLMYSSTLRKLDRLDEALAQEKIYQETAPKLQGPRQRTGTEILQEALDLDPLLKEAAAQFEAKEYTEAADIWGRALEKTRTSVDDPEHGKAARELVVWLERRIRLARDLAG